MLTLNLYNPTNTTKDFRHGNNWLRCVTPTLQTLMDLSNLTDSINASSSCRYHLGIHKDLKRSTISYANNHRNPEVFKKLFYSLRDTLNRSGRKKFRTQIILQIPFYYFKFDFNTSISKCRNCIKSFLLFSAEVT